jgi:hypothetical protein
MTGAAYTSVSTVAAAGATSAGTLPKSRTAKSPGSLACRPSRSWRDHERTEDRVAPGAGTRWNLIAIGYGLIEWAGGTETASGLCQHWPPAGTGGQYVRDGKFLAEIAGFFEVLKTINSSLSQRLGRAIASARLGAAKSAPLHWIAICNCTG